MAAKALAALRDLVEGDLTDASNGTWSTTETRGAFDALKAEYQAERMKYRQVGGDSDSVFCTSIKDCQIR